MKKVMVYISEISYFENLIKETSYKYFTDMQCDFDKILQKYQNVFNDILISLNYNNNNLNDVLESTCKIFEGFSTLLIEREELLRSLRENIRDKYRKKIQDVLMESASEITKICVLKYRLSKKEIIVVNARYGQIIKSTKSNFNMFMDNIISESTDICWESLIELDKSIYKYIDIINCFCNFNYDFSSVGNDELFIKKNAQLISQLIQDLKKYNNNNINIDEFNSLINSNVKLPLNDKIFNYKQMEKVAISNDYDYKWSNGSHRIYEHKTTKKIVVIPSHDLGLGLSKKIQKQIFNNSF